MRKRRVFDQFKSGYTIAIFEDYNTDLIDLAMQGWMEQNPYPKQEDFTTIETVRAKGGTTREIKHFDQNGYNSQINIWLTMRENFKSDLRLQWAVDRESIDQSVLSQARERMEEMGLPYPKDDVKFYLQLIADKGHGVPGDEDYRPNEVGILNSWIDEKKGPPGALIEHLMKTRFQNGMVHSQESGVRGHLGSAAEAETESTVEGSGEVDASESGESGGV